MTSLSQMHTIRGLEQYQREGARKGKPANEKLHLPQLVNQRDRSHDHKSTGGSGSLAGTGAYSNSYANSSMNGAHSTFNAGNLLLQKKSGLMNGGHMNASLIKKYQKGSKFFHHLEAVMPGFTVDKTPRKKPFKPSLEMLLEGKRLAI